MGYCKFAGQFQQSLNTIYLALRFRFEVSESRFSFLGVSGFEIEPGEMRYPKEQSEYADNFSRENTSLLKLMEKKNHFPLKTS